MVAAGVDYLGQMAVMIRQKQPKSLLSDAFLELKIYQTRNAFCLTWYLPHSHVNNERTVPVIMSGCIAHARNGRISTSGEKSDVTIVFLDPDFLNDAKISAIRVHLRQI